MGGLAGLIHFRGDAPDPAVLTGMSARLTHRGPDGEGSFVEGPAALAHRLRQVVPSKSAQPCVADDIVVMLDGWIYDHADVAHRAGHAQGVQTDVEAVAWAWRAWGLDLPHHLEGDYAIAIWDRRARTVHLMRDRMGVRPMFWAKEGDRFAFASEIPALLTVPWVSQEVDHRHLAEYLEFRTVHAPRTLLRDVVCVEPAHTLTATADGLKTRAWWRPQYALSGENSPDEGEVLDGLQEAVLRSVRRRMSNAPEVGLYLSGGLGSSAIASAIRTLHREVPSFTITFADDPNPESPFAGRVAHLLGIKHHEVVVGSAELASTFDDAVAALGQPSGNPAQVLQLSLARAARKHVRVVLSGDGGQELFGGRMLDPLARSLRAARAFSLLPKGIRRSLTAPLSRFQRGRRATAPLDRYGLELGMGGSELFDVKQRQLLLSDADLVRPNTRHDVLAPFYDEVDTDPVNAVLHAYLRSWLCAGSLTRADRTSAAAGLDIRFPLLDGDVVARAQALPGPFKLRRVGGSLHTRWLLRTMLTGVLPPPLVNRPKRGMPTPLDQWLAGPGRLFLEDRVSRLRDNRRGLWRTDYVESLRSGVGRNQPGCGIRLWSLFLLDAWLDSLT
jgi:asparagine synthase (glutamine-hydrolysing)